jgi:hypothetical protein
MEVTSCFDGDANKLYKGSLENGNGSLILYDIDGNLSETQIIKDGLTDN